MNPGPSTVREATIRAVFNEMGPLLDRADDMVRITKEAHALIGTDLAKMGAMMSDLEKLLEHSAENSTVLVQELKTSRGGAVATPAAKAPQVQHRAVPPRRPAEGFPWLRMMLMCILTAFLAVAGTTVLQWKTVEQARLGRSVLRALPHLDPASKAKLEAAIQKGA